MRNLIEQKMIGIVGEPFWAVGRAAALLWIQIGERQSVAAWGGGTKEVGKYALHIDCSWHWKQGAIAIADQNSSLDMLSNRLQSPIFCRNITVTSKGVLKITFNDDSILTVIADARDPDDEDKELWRFFQPGEDTPHLVVGPQGIIM